MPDASIDSSQDFVVSNRALRLRRIGGALIHLLLFLITASSAIAVIFIFFYIGRDAIPFFTSRGFTEFFTENAWFPASDEPRFGALAIFYGSGMVALTSMLIAVPVGIAAAICLSDVLPFQLRQVAKPVIEMLAAIPSVVYGFFALVLLAPLLQNQGGMLLTIVILVLTVPLLVVALIAGSDFCVSRLSGVQKHAIRVLFIACGGGAGFLGLYKVYQALAQVQISSGTNALNVSFVLAIMALPTIVSVAEDALQSTGRDLREGSYAMGATRAETMLRVVLPAAASGVCAAVILGFMRAIGETMVVWMASGNAAQIPEPWYNLFEPVRTLTATIAGDMGEADQVTGADRYHVLFAMGFCLLLISFILNLLSEWAVKRSRRKMRGET